MASVASNSNALYADPSVYDILHTPGTADEVDVLEGLAQRFGPPTGRRSPRWLEPACGSGRYLRVAAGRGAQVAGFDHNTDMIDYARRRLKRRGLLRRARLFVGDFTDFAGSLGADPIDFAFCTINTIRHLDSDRAMHAHFAQIARVLAPGGIYVVGVSLSAYGVEAPSEDVWDGARGRCRVKQVVQYLPPEGGRGGTREEMVVSHLVVQRPSGRSTLDTSYALRSYDRRQWRRLLQGSALRIAASVSDRGKDMQDHDGNYVLYVLERA